MSLCVDLFKTITSFFCSLRNFHKLVFLNFLVSTSDTETYKN